MEEDILDYNFWPSFADLMLALVLVMVMTMFAFIFYMSINNLNLKKIENNQLAFVNELAKSFNTNYKKVENEKNTYDISFSGNNAYDIRVVNDAKVQHVTFSTHILFPVDDYRLNANGQDVIRKFGGTLKENMFRIDEIQIQGHADSNKSTHFKSNLELAALRSMQVYGFLQTNVGIDPSRYLMSITSFGEYKPVTRKYGDAGYDYEKLKQANDTEEKRGMNRRIEVLLFYN